MTLEQARATSIQRLQHLFASSGTGWHVEGDHVAPLTNGQTVQELLDSLDFSEGALCTAVANWLVEAGGRMLWPRDLLDKALNGRLVQTGHE